MLAFNLLSINKSTATGNTAIFSNEYCKIFSPRQNLVCVCEKQGNLYTVLCEKAHNEIITNSAKLVTETNSTELCHRRFGHLSVQNLERLSDDKLVIDLKLEKGNKMDFCEPCVNGKHKRTSEKSCH